MNDVQIRVLRSIADRLSRERVVELHLFPAIRQGPAESGVVVIAATPDAAVPGGPTSEEATNRLADDGSPVVPVGELGAEAPLDRARRVQPNRHTVYSARYRLTLKGAERGKWEFDLVEEADAPLVTIDAVVRGVQDRTGDGAIPERMSGDEFRAVIAEPGGKTS